MLYVNVRVCVCVQDELENAHADMYSKDLRARMDSATTTGSGSSSSAVARPASSGVRSPKRDYKEIEELLEKVGLAMCLSCVCVYVCVCVRVE